MSQKILTATNLMPELIFTTSRSGGPGGQNVNKVNSKVTLRFSVVSSAILSDEQKEILLTKLQSKLTQEGELVVNAQEARSQIENKEIALKKFDELIAKAFFKKKARKASKPSKASVKKRLEEKKMHSKKKQLRNKGLE